MSTPSPVVAPSPNLVTPAAQQHPALPSTPFMASGDADVFAGLSLDAFVNEASKDFSQSFLNNSSLDEFQHLQSLLNSAMSTTPSMDFTPSVVNSSPALDLMPSFQNPAVRQPDLLAGFPELGLFTGTFGFAQPQQPLTIPTENTQTKQAFDDLIYIINDLNHCLNTH